MTSDRRKIPWTESLAAGFGAGFLGGLLFLAVALVRDGADFFAYWPNRAFAAWLVVRSAGLYGLLFALPGSLFAAGLHLTRIAKGRRVFALILGAAIAFTVFAYLTAWWQIDVLEGLPLDARERRLAALEHGAYALLTGTAVAFGLLRWRRAASSRPGSGRPASAALATAVLLIAAAEAGLAFAAPGAAGEARPGMPRRVIVVGLDGMTFRVLSPLVRAGELPTFQRLLDEGAWGTHLTYGTASSPRLWTSMATGKRTRDHGIDDFVKAGHGDYRATPVKSFDRKARAVWNILGDFGRRVAVVNWLVTFPPEEVNGYVVSRLHMKSGPRTFPPELAHELAGLAADHPPRPDDRSLLRPIDRLFDTARHLLGKEDLDFVALFDATVDEVEHRDWRQYQPEAFDSQLWDQPGAEAQTDGEVEPRLVQVYRHLDRRLGELMQRLDPETLLLVVSDHGQRAADRPRVRLRLDRILDELGYARTLEAKSGNAPGRLSPDRIDPAASRAYPLVETLWTPVSRINLNLRGREPKGIVDPWEAPSLRRRLASDLRQLALDNGRLLFSRVVEAADGADIEVVPSRAAYRLDGSRSLNVSGRGVSMADLQQVDTRISGEHDHQGIFFAHGPGIEPGPIGLRAVPTALHDLLWHLTDKIDAVDALLPPLRRLGLVESATTLDLTPTVLHALGHPAARDMAGRPLAELFSAPREVQWVASYEIPQAGDGRDGETPSDEEVLERLRALGYVN